MQPKLNSKQQKVQQLPEYVQDCHSDELAAQIKGASQIRKLLSRVGDPPISDIISTGTLR